MIDSILFLLVDQAKTNIKMNNRILIKQAENQVKQQLIGGLVLLTTGLMLINTFIGFPKWASAVTDITNLTFNVTGGSLAISNAPVSMAFPTHSFGYSGQNAGNEDIDGLTINDYRGTSTAWTVALNSNGLTDTSNSNLVILANKLNAYAEAGIISNVENGDTTRTAKGTNGTLNNAGITLLNGSTQALGVFQYDNGKVNLTLGGTESTGTYAGILTYTLT